MVVESPKKLSKEDAFKKIAERRTNRVLDSLRLLGQCSNRRSYEYTESQVQKIFNEIRQGVREAEKRFKSGKRDSKFKL